MAAQIVRYPFETGDKQPGNSTLRATVEAFLLTLDSEGRTSETIRWYRDALEIFVRWVEETGTDHNPRNWSATDMRSYLVAVKNRKKVNGQTISETTVSNYARALSGFCGWLFLEGYADRPILERVKLPKPPKLVKETYTGAEIARLLESARQSNNPLRDEAVILFLVDSGVRASELTGMQFADVDWDRRLARVSGKGRKQRWVPFSAATSKVMLKYALQERVGPEDGVFFTTDDGLEYTKNGFRYLILRIGKRAGIAANPHKFRHTAAITFLRAGGNPFELQKLLGHTDLTMTLRYSALNVDDMKTAHDAHSPVSFLLNAQKGGKKAAVRLHLGFSPPPVKVQD